MDRLILVLLFGLAAPAFASDISYERFWALKKSSEQSRMNIILPKVVVSGQSTTALVHFHDKDEQHNVTLRLFRPSVGVVAQNTVVIKGNGVVWLNVPNQDNGICSFHVLLDCVPTDMNCSVYAKAQVKVTGSIRDVIIRPSSNYYRPGETIVFWILAIDYNLHAPASTLAKLYVRDSNGVAQGIWEDIPLSEGTKEFQISISERAPLGKWTIEVRSEGNLYSSELNVSLVRGSNQLPNREQVVTEKHFVELHFSDKMRRKYKPGLPLMGKVEAVSSEEEVRVRVKVIDDQRTVLYSQDIDMTSREGTFTVPAVITNTEQITVQAELISLGGKDVDSQYVLARETLRKWNSESNCYLLIKDLNVDLKPDEDVQMTVLTSCPCSSDMHYVVTTEGKMISLGELKLTNQTNVPVTLNNIMTGVNIYEFNISFPVEAQMAPISNLLVYYTTNSGEIIGDSISFNVRLHHEKVSLIVNENNLWYEEETIRVGVLSFPKTHICLVGGRVDNTLFWNKRQSHSDHQSLEDNLTFLTSVRGEEETLQLPKHESYFPSTIINQVWLWKCFNYTDDVETNGVTLPATGGTGSWNLWALSLSDTVELRLSDPVTINVFSPINVHFELPTTVKVMEIVQVEITISSNMNACIDIHALVALSEGAIYPGIDVSIVSEKLRLGGHGATSIVVRIQPVTVGLKTISANVSCYVREACEEPIGVSEDFDEKAPITSFITRSENLHATTEGIEKVHTESAYFCANEEIFTLESRSIRYSFAPAPRKKHSVIFDVMAADNFRIALTEQENSTKNIYQIYLGDADNSISWIGRGKHNYEVHLSSAQTADILSATQYQTFWLSWENSKITVGKGNIIGVNAFLTHIMDKKMKVNLIGFATNFGVEGRVRIFKYNDESGYSQVLRLDIPHHIISGTERGNLYVTGGLALPFFQQLEPAPRTHPFSSLAALLSSFTWVLSMDANMWDTKWIQTDYNRSYAYEVTQKNIQNLLAYTHKDFSFSDHPNITDFPSTVKVLEILSRAQYYWKIDPLIIDRIRGWISTWQKEDGHFEINPTDTLEQKLITTAETLAAFLETNIDEFTEDLIDAAFPYFVQNLQRTNDTYTLSVVGYTLALLKSDLVDSVLSRMHIPMRTDEKENEWQNSQTSSVPSPFDWLYDKEKRMSDEGKRNLSARLIADYKSAAYAALIHTMRKDINQAEPIIRYIFSRSSILNKHPELSYLVTKVLTAFASVSRDVHPALTISLATSGMELTDTLELKSDYTTHTLELPSLPTKVFIYATGAGCSTVQSKITYLTYDTESVYPFDFVSYIEEEIPAHYNVVGDPEGLFPQLIIKTCFKLEKPSTGLKIEAILFSGYRVNSILSVSPRTVDFTNGFSGDKTWFAFANVTANCGICIRYLIDSPFIISSLRPIFFRMYEIENPHIVHELFVHSTNKESLLRTDITDVHFITWFGSQSERTDYDNELSRFQRCESSNPTDTSTPFSLLQSDKFDQLKSNKIVREDKLNTQQNTSTTVHSNMITDTSTATSFPFTETSTIITEVAQTIIDLQPHGSSTSKRTTHSETSTTPRTTRHIGSTATSESTTQPVSGVQARTSTTIKPNIDTKLSKKKKAFDVTKKEKPSEKAISKKVQSDVKNTSSTARSSTRRKDLNKVVVGQNELTFDSHTDSTTITNRLTTAKQPQTVMEILMDGYVEQKHQLFNDTRT